MNFRSLCPLLLTAAAVTTASAQGITIINRPPSGAVGQPYSFQFQSTGAPSFLYAWSCTDLCLNPVPGLVLLPNGLITGTPSTAGLYNVIVVVVDPNHIENTSGLVRMTLQIAQQPLTITTATVPDAVRGAPYSAPLAANGGSGGYTWALSSGTLPGNLTVTSGGAISGTPSGTATAGPYNFTVQVTDSTNSVAYGRLSLTLRNAAISLAPASLPPGILTGAYASGVTASGGSGGPYTYSWSGTTPPGLNLNGSTGAITGTPTATGTFRFSIGASDGSQYTPAFPPQSYSITVYPTISIAPSSLANGDAGANYLQTFTASGGSGLGYTFSINTTPPGMAFNSSGTLSGAPTAVGPNNFSVTVRDNLGFTASQSYTLNVNSPISLSPATLNAGQVGTAYSQAFNATGGSGAFTYTISGTTPPGLSFNNGTLSGTPTRAGSYSFTVTARDSLGYSNSLQYTLAIGNPPITVTPASIPSGQVGVAYSQTFSAAGGNGGPYTFSISPPGPFGLTFSSSSATLSGTPTNSGSATVTITASDGTQQGHSDYTLTIAPAPLTLSPSSIPNGSVGTAYSQVFTATGGLGNYTFSLIGTAPPGLTLASSGATATLAGNPTTGGQYSFTVQVGDGSKTASQNLTVSISNAALTLSPATLPPGIVNGNYSQTLTASGGNGGPYTYTLSGNAPGLTLNTSTGVLSGTPSSATTYNFTIGVSDGSQLTPPFQAKSYSISVYPAITVAPATLSSVAAGVSYSQTFTASGGSGTGYSYSISTLPAGLTFNSATGVLSGQTTAGSTTFTITARDSASFTGTATYTLLVNSSVTLTPTSLSAIQTGTAYSQSFTASGGSGNYSYTLGGTPPAGLTFTGNTLSGTPTAGGNYSFSVSAKDSQNATVTNNYTLTVNNPALSLGPATLNSGVVNGAYSQTFTASGGTGGPYTYSITGSTPGLTLNPSTGVLSGTPTSAATYNFNIGVSDGSQFTPPFTPKSYSIPVLGAITISPGALPNAEAQVAYSQTFTAAGGSGSGYTYSISTPPPGLTLNSATGVLSGQPSASGTYTFTVTARDGMGLSGTSGNITLTVNAGLTLLPASLLAGQVGTGYSQAFTAGGGSGGYTYSLSGSAPPGLTLSNGVLSGTPTTNGNFTFTVTAKDSLGGTVSNSYTMTVGNASIVVQPTAISAAQVGVQYTQVFTATGGNGSYTFSIASPAPFGLSFNAASATLSGSPTGAGTANITISATDGSQTGQRTYTLTVAPAGLTLSPGTIDNGVVGTKYSQSFTASGGSGNYTFTLSPSAPAGLTFSSNGATAALSGTPTQSGSFPLTVQVSDGTTTVPHTYTLAISPSSLSITSTTLPGGTQSTPYAANLSATGGAPPYKWAIVSTSALPGGLMLSSAGSISGTPTDPGTFPVGVTVTDSFGSTATASLSLSIQAAPLTITTTSPLPPALSDTAYSVTFSATGGAPPYSFALNSAPPGLTLSGATLSGKLSNPSENPLTFNVSIQVTDSASNHVGGNFQIALQPAAAGLILSAGSLSIPAVSGGAMPPPQFVSVSSTTQSNVKFTVSSDSPWLSATPGGGSTPATLQVNIIQSFLSAAPQPKVYTGTITVTGPDGTHTVSVSMNVKGLPPQLVVAPPLVSITTDGVSQPAAGSIQISNAGSGTVTYSASVLNGSSWISLGNAPTSVTSDSPVTIPVNVAIAGLANGDYRDVIHIDSTAGTADVPVTLLVAGSSTITLAPSGSLTSSRQGQSVSNGTRSFQVITTGTRAVNWTASLLDGSGWLTLNTPGGTSSAGNPGVVSYTVNPGNLATGDYYARIHIDAPGATNSPVDFLVVATVAPTSTPAAPDPAPAGLLFISSAGSPVPPAQTIVVHTSSSSLVSFSASANTQSGGNWLSASITNGNAGSNAPGQVQATVNPAGLLPGVYQGGISFTMQGNPSDVRTVNVILIVAGGGQSSQGTDSPAVSKLAPLELVPQANCAPSRLVALQTGLVSNFSTPAGWPTPLAIQLADDCGNAVNNGSVVATFSNGDAPLPLLLSDSKNAVYSATWNPHGVSSQVTVNARATAPSLQAASAQIVGAISPNKVPILYRHGTIHNLNPQPGAPLAPGTIVQIYGSGLAPGAAQTSLPLPTNVSGTTVIIGGIEAPLYYVSDGQINAEMPLELAAGRQYQILVSANGALTTPDTLDIEPVTPGVATQVDGDIIAQHVDGSYVTASSPAQPGEILTIYLAGMGLTDVSVKTGDPGPTTPLAHPMVAPTVTVNGEAVQISFAGLTPQSVGLYQINFTVPQDAPGGNLKLVVAQGDTLSNTSTLIVQPQ